MTRSRAAKTLFSDLPAHPYLLHGLRPRYSVNRRSARLKGVFLFKAGVSPTEAARPLREHLAPRIARVTLPKCAVAVPSSLMVIQASTCPVCPSDVTFVLTPTTVDTYRPYMPFWAIFLPSIRLYMIGKSPSHYYQVTLISNSYLPWQAATPNQRWRDLVSQVIRFDYRVALLNFLRQGPRLRAAYFRPCPSGRNTDHCGFTRPVWSSVSTRPSFSRRD